MSKLSELKSTPATLVAQTRVDSRHLAALALYWHNQNEHARSTSELIRLSLEEFSKLLISNQMVEFPETQEHALEVLTRLGITSVKIQSENMTKSMLAEQGLNMASLTRKRDASAPILRKKKVINSITEAEMMTELEQRLSEDTKSRVENSKDATHAALAALGQIQPANSEEEP